MLQVNLVIFSLSTQRLRQCTPKYLQVLQRGGGHCDSHVTRVTKVLKARGEERQRVKQKKKKRGEATISKKL